MQVFSRKRPILPNDFAPGRKIMPATPVGIEQYPDIAEPEAGEGQQAADEANRSLIPGDGITGCRAHANFPGTHSQGLPAVGPEPPEISEADYR